MNIAIVVSSQLTLTSFLQTLIVRLSEHHKVTIIVNTDGNFQSWMCKYDLTVKSIKIVRNISLWKDIKALIVLNSYFRKNKFDLVYSVTPKAGLLAMTAGYFAGIKYRIHIFTGQVWVTKTGIMRNMLKSMDSITAKFASQLLTDSYSQREFLIGEGVIRSDKIKVLANGSISGVDLNKFQFNAKSRKQVRERHGVKTSELVILFLGRLTPDKGIFDLADAFKIVAEQHKGVKLVIVGPDEAGIRDLVNLRMGVFSEHIIFSDYTEHPEEYMSASDIICLPSYREGFGSVLIEAAAVGLPAIGSNIYGIKDAIKDQETGLLFPVGNVHALYHSMKTLVLDPDLRLRLGKAAHIRAEKKFSQEFVTTSFINYFNEVIESV